MKPRPVIAGRRFPLTAAEPAATSFRPRPVQIIGKRGGRPPPKYKRRRPPLLDRLRNRPCLLRAAISRGLGGITPTVLRDFAAVRRGGAGGSTTAVLWRSGTAGRRGWGRSRSRSRGWKAGHEGDRAKQPGQDVRVHLLG